MAITNFRVFIIDFQSFTYTFRQWNEFVITSRLSSRLLIENCFFISTENLLTAKELYSGGASNIFLVKTCPIICESELLLNSLVTETGKDVRLLVMLGYLENQNTRLKSRTVYQIKSTASQWSVLSEKIKCCKMCVFVSSVARIYNHYRRSCEYK